MGSHRKPISFSKKYTTHVKICSIMFHQTPPVARAQGISIFYISASEQAIRQRIKVRAEQTGRDVPEHLIVASLQAAGVAKSTGKVQNPVTRWPMFGTFMDFLGLETQVKEGKTGEGPMFGW